MSDRSCETCKYYESCRLVADVDCDERDDWRGGEMKTFAEEVKETLYEFANNYGLLVGDTKYDNYIIDILKSLILSRIESCHVINLISVTGKKIDEWGNWTDEPLYKRSDLKRAFNIEEKEK